MKILLFTFAFLLLSSLVHAAQPQPAGTQTLTSVVGKKWDGVKFRVDFDEAAIAADSTMLITIAFLTSPDNKTYRTISVSHIKGGTKKLYRSGTADTLLNFPVEAGYYARLAVTCNKPLVYSMSMGAK